ncbi:MAG: hypothetical protein M0C28_29205 [Candidatus Moduliflexus flocculans]|nr:hypothetical protein [Candidatus Moduliflexus flocculans]
MLQGVSVFSIYGLTLVIMLVNYAVAQGLMLAFDHKWRFDGQPALDRKMGFQWMTGVAALFVLWAGSRFPETCHRPDGFSHRPRGGDPTWVCQARSPGSRYPTGAACRPLRADAYRCGTRRTLHRLA